MLLGRRHEVLLSDFGIALMVQTMHYQDVQDVAGALPYMAPEQIQGQPRPASDQYSSSPHSGDPCMNAGGGKNAVRRQNTHPY